MTTIGVVLSGCGVYDGSEIHEATLILYFLDKKNITIQCLAPDISQRQVINHVTGKEMKETRNVLVEAARIARGNIKNIAEVSADDFDALIFPGGFGAAKNLSDYAFKGDRFTVNDHVRTLVADMRAARKPLGFTCISPVIAAKLIPGVTVTVGNDPSTIEAIEASNAKHLEAAVEDILYDEKNNVITTPAYMYNARISEVAAGIEKLVGKVVELAQKPVASKSR